MKPLFILGAGISAPSGIPTYRQDNNSLYNDDELMDIMHVASLYNPERLKKLQHHFANWKALINSKQPNPAYTIITEMVETYGGFVVTQNVDNYLELTGLNPKRIYHIHGDFSRKKPRHNVVNIVLFGESLIEEPVYLKRHFKDFDKIIIAGTSLTVTSVYKYIKPDADIYIINKEPVELPLPQEMYKTVTFIQKDIIDGLQDLQKLWEQQ